MASTEVRRNARVVVCIRTRLPSGQVVEVFRNIAKSLTWDEAMEAAVAYRPELKPGRSLAVVSPERRHDVLDRRGEGL